MDSSKTQNKNGPQGHYPHQFHQNVIVLRHGDRLDNFDPMWISTAARPWDPPLVTAGKERAFSTGRNLRANLGFPIHRVFVSPFIRCIQTAAEVVSALCAVDDDPASMTGDGVLIDSSKIKVSIEYGICEMLNKEAIRNPPKDMNWGINISELEAMLPAGTVDHTVVPLYKELPQWEETVKCARDRYTEVIRALADKYPSENLLLVTHGEGVGVAVSVFMENILAYEVNYCAYAHARRSILFDKSQSFTAEGFEVVTDPVKTGIRYAPSNDTVDV